MFMGTLKVTGLNRFMPIKSNNKKMSLYLHITLIFVINSLSLYFTKMLLHA